MVLTRLAVGLEPLNALDAVHRSPQSAPQTAKQRFGSPVGSATHRSIKRNKELADTFNLFAAPSSVNASNRGAFCSARARVMRSIRLALYVDIRFRLSDAYRGTRSQRASKRADDSFL